MKILRNLFYVNTKISTGYQYKDQFSIIPVDGLNELTDLATYYPCIIEVKYDGPDIDPLCTDHELTRTLFEKRVEFYSKRIRQILSLLSVFTVYHFKMPSGQMEWYNDGIKNCWILPIYIINDLVAETDSFSAIISPTEISFENDYLISFQKRFILPYNLDILFDLYFGSTEDFSERFYKSAMLYYNARNLYYESVSLSFAAFISSIETLAQYNYQEKNICDKCGQPQFSATRKFKEFLLTYGGGKYIDKTFIEKVYKWRSDMLHTGELFIWELERTFSMINPNYGKREEQMTTLMVTYFYVRVALVNFLLQEAKQKQSPPTHKE
jgi:hypothetical protein